MDFKGCRIGYHAYHLTLQEIFRLAGYQAGPGERPLKIWGAEGLSILRWQNTVFFTFEFDWTPEEKRFMAEGANHSSTLWDYPRCIRPEIMREYIRVFRDVLKLNSFSSADVGWFCSGPEYVLVNESPQSKVHGRLCNLT